VQINSAYHVFQLRQLYHDVLQDEKLQLFSLKGRAKERDLISQLGNPEQIPAVIDLSQDYEVIALEIFALLKNK
jgi:hypothetical protein